VNRQPTQGPANDPIMSELLQLRAQNERLLRNNIALRRLLAQIQRLLANPDELLRPDDESGPE
jgi:hypothetical protein